MPIQHSIWTVGAEPKALETSRLANEQTLEEMIVRDSRVLSSEWMLIGQQEVTSFGGRIDLLAIAPDGSLVLKRDRTPREIIAQALEFIKDKISKLDWEEMQELVAGLLRAMGYKTLVSARGPDRGKDIVASPDGFGFESPRIVVEVKHRSGVMGSSAIRSFLGGRHQDDKGLYVSTGGFSKDAYYEAERAKIPLTLMSLDHLVQALLEYYEKLDLDTQQLVPLKKIYWPI